jgi:hypothetical protein
MRNFLIPCFVIAAPRAALACPVCFGQNDSPLALAMNQGVLFMLVVVVAVLAAFGAFIVRLAWRQRLFDDESRLDAACTHKNPQEGTV